MTTEQPASVERSATPDDGEMGGDPPADARPVVLARVAAIARRVPFTIAYVSLALVLGIVLGPLWADLAGRPWYVDVAYGLPALEAGRWLTLAWGPLFALSPVLYLASLASFAALVGFSEWRLGTGRTIAIAIVFQVLTVFVTAAFLWLVRDLDWAWVRLLAAQTDVGFSGGMLAVAAVASATLRPPWQLRLRLVLVAYVLFSLALVGQLADLEHLLAIVISLPFAARLAGDRAVRGSTRPSRDEQRLIATIGLLTVAAAQVVVHVVPDRLTPFGPAEHTPWTAALVIAAAVIWFLIARGLRRGRAWAWWIGIFTAAVPVAAAALLGIGLLVGPADVLASIHQVGVPQLLAGASMYAALLVVLVTFRGAYLAQGPAISLKESVEAPDTARELLKLYGGCSTSWMMTWPRMRHMVTADGQAFIGFREHAGVAIALGDPVGPNGFAADTIDEFVRRCEAGDLMPFLFSCTSASGKVARARGWQVVQIAEDNLIDLPDLAFTGKKWQAVRTALNKAPKEGIEFRLVVLADEPPAILEQVERVSGEWLGEKALPEMGFTLGGVPEALDRDVRVGLAVDGEGRVHGVTSWLPAYGPDGRVRGWTLDVMRRIEFEGGFRPTMEFLIASSCLAFKEQGAAYVSLSGAPLARTGASPESDGPIEKLLDMIGELMEPLYGFRSLHQFKAKFQPRLDPMYMAFRDEADLPRIGIAITRAFLPDAGVGDVVNVVRSVTDR